MQSVGLTQEHLLGTNLDTELKRAADSDDVLYGKDREVRSQRGFGYDHSNSGESSGTERNLGKEGIETFITPQGEVYGFVDKEGNIYLDETKISPEHPIHEYTHLWDRAVQKRNPELWNRGVALMKQSSLWDEILNSKNYGKNWQSLGITGERLENLIASEIHSRLTGKQGASIIQKLEAEGGASNIVDRIKQWLLAFWKEVKAIHIKRL